MKHEGDNEKPEMQDGLNILMSALDWKAAMRHACFNFQDIEEIITAIEGEPECERWRLVVKLKSGKYGWLIAWCDYSGWGCQEGGDSDIVETLAEAEEKVKI